MDVYIVTEVNKFIYGAIIHKVCTRREDAEQYIADNPLLLQSVYMKSQEEPYRWYSIEESTLDV